jgi:ribosomal protein L15
MLHRSNGDEMTEDKLQEAISRGARADALLKNDLLQDAFARLEQDYIEAWKISPARDTDGRERLWQAVNIVAKVRDHIVKVVNDGKLSQRHLEELAHRVRRRAQTP